MAKKFQRRGRKSFKGGTNAPAGPTPKGMPRPNPKVLRKVYLGLITANLPARLAALSEAIRWWDAAIPTYMARTPMDVDKIKMLGRANKARNTGIGTATNSDHEKEVGMKTALGLYEKLFPSYTGSRVNDIYKKYESVRDRLERKEKDATQRYAPILSALNSAFAVLNMKFTVVKTTDTGKRSFDGKDTILLPVSIARELLLKYKSEGMLAVLFSEFFGVIKAFGVEWDEATKTHTRNLERMLCAVPVGLEAVLTYCATVPKQKVFKQYLGTLEAVGQYVSASRPLKHVQAGTAVPRPGFGHIPVSKVPRAVNNASLVAGRFQPASAMAILYNALADQQVHNITEVFKILQVTNPEGRLRSLTNIGKKNGNWTIVADVKKNTLHMTIN